MAEGPLVHRYAKQLREILQGRQVRIEFELFPYRYLRVVLRTEPTLICTLSLPLY